jgi:drug/metabolite transporter (DMT)-like permease
MGGVADLVMLVTNVAYGSAYVAQQVALDGVPPALLGFVRLALASLVLWPLPRRRSVRPAAPGDRVKIVWMGVLGFGLAYTLAHFGMQRSTATNAALLITIEPVAMLLMARVFLDERLRSREAVGAGLVLVGSLVIVLNGVPGVTMAVVPHWRGDLLLVLSAFAFASYSVLGRDVLARWDPSSVTLRSIVWGAISMGPVVALEWAAGVRPSFGLANTAATLYLAVILTALAYLAWNWALARMPAPRAAIFINVQPVVGVALGVGLLGEPATLYTFAGAALVLAGLAVTTGYMGGLAAGPPSPPGARGAPGPPGRPSGMREGPATMREGPAGSGGDLRE